MHGIESKIRKPFRKSVEFCVKNQFVTMTPGSTKAWHVVSGSGMGLTASDELSSIDSAVRAEYGYALLPSVVQKYSICCYLRYKDDILLGMDCSEDLRLEFIEGCRIMLVHVN